MIQIILVLVSISDILQVGILQGGKVHIFWEGQKEWNLISFFVQIRFKKFCFSQKTTTARKPMIEITPIRSFFNSQKSYKCHEGKSNLLKKYFLSI